LRQSADCDWQFRLCLATIRGRCSLSETAQSIRPLGEDDVNATNITALRELTSRSANGVHARLLWAGPERYCSVAVTDITTGEAFQIEVRADRRVGGGRGVGVRGQCPIWRAAAADGARNLSSIRP
jgi:hypothetical protein